MDVEMYLNPKAGEQHSLYLADPLVAMLPGVRGRVAQAAADGAAVAAGILAASRETGNAHIKLEMAGGPDFLVSLVDPDQTDGGLAAIAIEGQVGALSGAFPINKVKRPDVQRSTKTGRYLKRRSRGGDGRFTRGS